MRKFVQNLKFLESDLIDLVDGIDTGHVDPTALDNIDEVISGCIVAQSDVSVVHPVFTANRLDSVEVKVGRSDCRRQIDTTFVFFPECQIRWLLVQPISHQSVSISTRTDKKMGYYYIPDSESFKLLFNETLVSYWLYGIKNNYDAVASPSSTYNLENS